MTLERIEKLKIGKDLTKNEIDVLFEVLFNREAGIAFDFMGNKTEVEHLREALDHTAIHGYGAHNPQIHITTPLLIFHSIQSL